MRADSNRGGRCDSKPGLIVKIGSNFTYFWVVFYILPFPPQLCGKSLIIMIIICIISIIIIVSVIIIIIIISITTVFIIIVMLIGIIIAGWMDEVCILKSR